MELSAIALLVVLVGLMAIGLPITWALGGACISAILLDPNLSLAMITQKIFTGCDNFAMLALPAFFLAGDIMAKGGLSGRLVSFADSLVGWISGGISLVSIVACAFFAAISGSSVATTAAMAGSCIRKWLNEITLRIILQPAKPLAVPWVSSFRPLRYLLFMAILRIHR